jgi:hypothetical protein
MTVCVNHLTDMGLRKLAAEEVFSTFCADIRFDDEGQAALYLKKLAKNYVGQTPSQVIAELQSFKTPDAVAFLALAGM